MGATPRSQSPILGTPVARKFRFSSSPACNMCEWASLVSAPGEARGRVALGRISPRTTAFHAKQHSAGRDVRVRVNVRIAGLTQPTGREPHGPSEGRSERRIGPANPILRRPELGLLLLADWERRVLLVGDGHSPIGLLYLLVSRTERSSFFSATTRETGARSPA
jgi:hypothetical protein